MYKQFTYTQAVEKAAHFIALNQTTVHIDDAAPDTPWDRAHSIECGGSYRFNGPTNFYVIAEAAGLTFKWSVDMEGRDANGRGVTLFDRDRLREVARKLPFVARIELAAFFQDKVMPDLKKRTAELREAMNKQIDSEDCVRGLIAFFEEELTKAAAA